MKLPTSTAEAYELGAKHYKDTNFINEAKLLLINETSKMEDMLYAVKQIKEDAPRKYWLERMGMVSMQTNIVQMINETLSVATGMQTAGNLRRGA